MKPFYEISSAELSKTPFQMIGEDWMLVTAKKEDKINTMTASWGGLGVMWGKQVTFVVIRPQRYTKEFVDSADTFSLSFLPDSYREALGYLGRVSGRDEDKIEKCGLTPVCDGETPYFQEAETVLICRKLYCQDYEKAGFLQKEICEKWYENEDFHTMYIAEIEKVLRRESSHE